MDYIHTLPKHPRIIFCKKKQSRLIFVTYHEERRRENGPKEFILDPSVFEIVSPYFAIILSISNTLIFFKKKLLRGFFIKWLFEKLRPLSWDCFYCDSSGGAFLTLDGSDCNDHLDFFF